MPRRDDRSADDEETSGVADQLAEQVRQLADLLDVEEAASDEILLADDEVDLMVDEDGAEAILYIECEGASYEVREDRFIIGRAACDLKIVDANVSRNHCVIDRIDGTYVIRDLGSTNGIEVRGRKVQKHRIAHGDVIVVSGHELHCSFSAASGYMEVEPEEDYMVPRMGVRVEYDRSDIALATTQSLEPTRTSDTVVSPEPRGPAQDDEAAFRDRMEVRLDAMAHELAELRDSVERLAQMFESVSVEAMTRLLQARAAQARRRR